MYVLAMLLKKRSGGECEINVNVYVIDHSPLGIFRINVNK